MELYELPASFGQQRMWLAELTQTGSSAYTITAALQLTGPLSEEAFTRAINDIVEQHEVLRTTLRLSNGQIHQVVHETDAVPVHIHTADPATLETAISIAEALAEEPFDLTDGPLSRHHLIRLTPEWHVYVAVIHHSVGDEHSLAVLISELKGRYSQHEAGVLEPMQEPALHYADFAAWQRQRADNGDYQDDVDFWARTLDQLEPLPGVSGVGRRGGRAPVHIPASVISTLKSFLGAGVTEHMMLMTAAAVVVSAWRDRRDFAIATTVSGRDEPQLDDMIGFFVNTLPIRIQLPSSANFLDAAALMRAAIVDGYEHAGAPFDLVVERLNPPRLVGRLPLAQVGLNLRQHVVAPTTFGQAVATEVDLAPAGTAFDLFFDLRTSDTGVDGFLLTARDTQDQSATALAAAFGGVLRTAAATPSADVTTFPALRELAQQRSSDTNTTATDSGQERDAVEDDPHPQNLMEADLLDLWRAELQLPELTTLDEFYASGGNSMLAVKIVVEARARGWQLPLEVMFGPHSIRDLSKGATVPPS